MHKIGRNDPCPCGSGKKYKKCCMAKMEGAQYQNKVMANPLRQLERSVFDKHLLPYFYNTFYPAIVEDAFADLIAEEYLEAMSKKVIYNNFFLPWILFHWYPSEEGDDIPGIDIDLTIAENYIAHYGDRLTIDEHAFISAMLESYYSLYAVVEKEPENTLLVKDILLGTTHRVFEIKGALSLNPGDIFLSRLLTMKDESIFIGMFPYLLPPIASLTIIDFRDSLTRFVHKKTLTPKLLRSFFEFEILDYAFSTIYAQHMQKVMLKNAEGDAFEFVKSTYTLHTSAEEVFNRLLPMTFKDEELLLEDAVYDSNGSLASFEIPWVSPQAKKQNYTVLGQITVEGNCLTFLTNSRKRHEKGEKLLKKYMEDDFTFVDTEVIDIKKAMASLNGDEKEALALPAGEDDSPEMQEIKQQVAKEHWHNWFKEPIPALDDKTPRQAARSKKGREKLEALLLYYQRMDQHKSKDDPLRVDLDYIRKTLKLDAA